MDIKLPKITRAKLVLTEKCQLNCKYCYEQHANKNMSLDLAKESIDYVIRNAEEERQIPIINFFGGEPLLVYEELMKPCIEYIRDDLKSRCYIGFTTNGLLLTEENLKYLRSKNVNFMLSIDGCKEAHDTNRTYLSGEGSFSEIEKKIPLMLKYYPNTRARMTVTPDTVKYLYDSVRYISDSGFIDMHILPDLFILPNKRDWTPEDFIVLKDQLTLFEEYVINTFESFEVPLIFQTYADMFTRIVLAMHCEKLGHHRTAKCCSLERRCGIGSDNNIIIDIEGNCYSCQHGSSGPIASNPLYLGNIKEGISEDRRLSLIKMNSSELHSNTLDCKECPLDSICTGGCVPNNYAVSGDFTTILESYCRWTRCIYDSASRVIKYFDEKKDNELFKDYFYGIVKRGVSCVC